eukprot:8600161-Lingulodinium_polyedra.AAC.1
MQSLAEAQSPPPQNQSPHSSQTRRGPSVGARLKTSWGASSPARIARCARIHRKRRRARRSSPCKRTGWPRATLLSPTM